jgi:hypothetical protein
MASVTVVHPRGETTRDVSSVTELNTYVINRGWSLQAGTYAAAYQTITGQTYVPATATTDAASSTPSYAGTGRTKTFDKTRSIYNPESPTLGKIRARAAYGAVAGAGRFQVLGLGHSYLAGSKATPGVNDTMTTLRRILAARTGGTARSYAPFRNGETRDSHYTAVGAGWQTTNVLPATGYGTSTTDGDTLTYTSTDTGTVLDFWVTADSTAFSYAVDGGAAVPLTNTGADQAVRVVTVTGLPNTTHTLTITKTGTGVTRFIGAMVRDTTGIEVYNFGWGGTTSSQWAASTAGTLRGIAASVAVQRDAVLIQVDTNDARTAAGNLTGPQWKTSIGTAIASHVGLGQPTALLLSPDGPSGIPAGRWDEYAVAAYELAEQYDIPLLDLRAVVGGWATAKAAGFTDGDDLHFNVRGWFVEANAIAGLLLP